MAGLLAFVRLTRPLFLYGGFAGVALGAAVAAWAGRPIDLSTYAWAQALVTAFHLMVHYANDYFDRGGDAVDRRTPWSGGSGVLSGGGLDPRIALIAALLCAALGAVAIARFALAGGAVVAWLGVAILVLAWCYSAPPVRLVARGLGELDVVLVVAIVVPCLGYAAFTGRVDETILTVVLGPAGAMFAMMLCVELPDAANDGAVGKRTLVVRWGPARSWQIASAVTLASFTIVLALGLRRHAGIALLALLPAAAFALALVRRASTDPRPATMALLGVGFYAATVTGLAVLYALVGKAVHP